MTLIAICLCLFLASVNGQTFDWNCNNLLNIRAVDYCYYLNETASFEYTCVSDDQMIVSVYDDTTCNGNVIFQDSTNDTSTFTCDQSEACSSVTFYYYLGNCTGSLASFPFTYFTDVCYYGSSASISYSCDYGEYTTYSYYQYGNCTGLYTNVTVSDFDVTIGGSCAVVCFISLSNVAIVFVNDIYLALFF